MAVTLFTRDLRTNDSESDLRFVIDSGAMQHMTPNREIFEDLKPTSRKIKAAGNSILNAQGEGDLTVVIEGNNRTVNTTLTDVLYAPDLTESLLSVSAVNDHRYDVLFKHDRYVYILN